MTDFHNRFTDNKEIVTACGRTLVNECVRNFMGQTEHKKNYLELTNSKRTALDPAIKSFADATLFLMVASGAAAHVRRELNNDFVKGNDYYP